MGRENVENWSVKKCAKECAKCEKAFVDKEELFREVWGYEFEGSTNLVEVGIRRLREKIEKDPSKPEYIRTIRGIGYRFCSVEPS